MKLSWFGRLALALFASLALGLGMTACGGGTIAYLWVLGQQYNQIAAFKVDDFTGNLTQAPHQPFSSQGSMPVMLVVKPGGGRFVYVLNQGLNGGPQLVPDSTGKTTKAMAKGSGSGVAVFSVGGDGSLTYLQTYTSQGYVPQWMQLSSDGSYLYVLDKYAGAGTYDDCLALNSKCPGSITAFSIDSTTGRLTLVQNTQSVPPGSPAPTYFTVGIAPFQMKATGTCLFTVNSQDQSITPYTFGTGGQLVTVTTGKITTSAATISSINGNSSYLILTDSAANTIIPYTVGSSCGLNIFNGGIQANATGTSNPTNSLISNNGKYLYILNQSTTNTTVTTPFSSISGFLIDATKGLSPLTGSPYSVDSGPVCAVEDPTNKYLYISDRNAGAVTGKIFDPNTGELSQLSRGSTFSATGLASCLAISGSVD
ncbi:MAG TPA: beta-propeller fold lactonase family protein [Acidobacteriaceae bacterium]|jgi:6-phosphogluconolactonase (cycloisomerase 2 family)|nr:beta-propeller fold lactonase family protein [Acidobacteriaceae bacterium]